MNHRKVEPDQVDSKRYPTRATHVTNNKSKVSRVNPYNLLHRAVAGSLFTLTSSGNSKALSGPKKFSNPLHSIASTFARLKSHEDTPSPSTESRSGGGKLKFSPPPESAPPSQCLTTSASKHSAPLLTRASRLASVSSIDKTRRHGREYCVIRAAQTSAFSSQRDCAKSSRPACYVKRTTMKLRERIVLGKFPLSPWPRFGQFKGHQIVWMIRL